MSRVSETALPEPSLRPEDDEAVAGILDAIGLQGNVIELAIREAIIHGRRTAEPRRPTDPLGPKCPDGDQCEHAIYLEEYRRVDGLHAAQVRKNALEEAAGILDNEERICRKQASEASSARLSRRQQLEAAAGFAKSVAIQIRALAGEQRRERATPVDPHPPENTPAAGLRLALKVADAAVDWWDERDGEDCLFCDVTTDGGLHEEECPVGQYFAATSGGKNR